MEAKSNIAKQRVRVNCSSRSLFSEGKRKVNWPGSVQDYKTGLTLLKQAATLGQVGAHEWLGAIYDYGLGTRKNGRLALKHYRIAAEARQPNAEYHVGVFYYKGVGVSKDYQLAIKWLRRAAKHGDDTAVYVLGRCYRFG